MSFPQLILVLLGLLLGPNKLKSVLDVVQPAHGVPMILVLLALVLGPRKMRNVLDTIQPTH